MRVKIKWVPAYTSLQDEWANDSIDIWQGGLGIRRILSIDTGFNDLQGPYILACCEPTEEKVHDSCMSPYSRALETQPSFMSVAEPFPLVHSIPAPAPSQTVFAADELDPMKPRIQFEEPGPRQSFDVRGNDQPQCTTEDAREPKAAPTKLDPIAVCPACNHLIAAHTDCGCMADHDNPLSGLSFCSCLRTLYGLTAKQDGCPF